MVSRGWFTVKFRIPPHLWVDKSMKVILEILIRHKQDPVITLALRFYRIRFQILPLLRPDRVQVRPNGETTSRTRTTTNEADSNPRRDPQILLYIVREITSTSQGILKNLYHNSFRWKWIFTVTEIQNTADWWIEICNLFPVPKLWQYLQNPCHHFNPTRQLCHTHLLTTIRLNYFLIWSSFSKERIQFWRKFIVKNNIYV